MLDRKTVYPLLLLVIFSLLLAACATPSGAAAGPGDPAGIRAPAPVDAPGQTTDRVSAPAETVLDPAASGPAVASAQAEPPAPHAAGQSDAPLHQTQPVAATGPLSDAEAAHLTSMYEEEKLARDLYTFLGETWGLPILANIASAEAQHMASVLFVMEAYDVETPAAAFPAGQFADPDLQALYDQLAGRGTRSATEALLVGGLVEETDIADLDRTLAETDNPDVAQLFVNLRLGSANHLRAFSANYERQTGTAYAPQALDQETYAAILAQAPAGGNGNGRGAGVNGATQERAGAGAGNGNRQGGSGNNSGNGYRGGRG